MVYKTTPNEPEISKSGGGGLLLSSPPRGFAIHMVPNKLKNRTLMFYKSRFTFPLIIFKVKPSPYFCLRLRDHKVCPSV
jgi:hypothetical protein